MEVDLSNQVVRILGNSPVKTMNEALEQTGRKARLIGQGVPEGWSNLPCIYVGDINLYIWCLLTFLHAGTGQKGKAQFLMEFHNLCSSPFYGFLHSKQDAELC